MKRHDCDQRSPEWFALRCGRLTGTAAGDMLATIKTGEAAARRDLRLRLVCERLTGTSQDNGYENAEMIRGRELEPEARAAYESLTGNLVESVGFLAHDNLMAGCSPDGLIGPDGLIEIKAPKTTTHIGYIKADVVPPNYRPQCIHNLWISERQWVEFVSYDDRVPLSLQLFVKRLHRADVDLKAYELAVRIFLTECEKEYADIERLAGAGCVLR